MQRAVATDHVMQVFSTSHLPPWAVDILFKALLRITAYVYRTTCCIVPIDHLTIQETAEGEALWHTMNELDVLPYIGAPASQVMMHPHCND